MTDQEAYNILECAYSFDNGGVIDISLSDNYDALICGLSALQDRIAEKEDGRLLPSKPIITYTTFSEEVDGIHYLLETTCEISKEEYEARYNAIAFGGEAKNDKAYL